MPLQTRLLRVLEEREVLRVGATEPTTVDVRVVAATLQTLESLVESQRFRRDLYYRLAALRIALPTLQARQQDVPQLLTHFFQQLGQRPSPLDAEATQRLCGYAWPGNVRELRNLVDRLRIHWPRDAGPLPLPQLLHWMPELEAIPAAQLPMQGTAAAAIAGSPPRPDSDALRQLLADCNGNREQLCARLGISRTTLWRWLRADV
jgi:propionate catabolism operon transcriptional regulator